MRTSRATLQKPLSRRLMPLAYALIAMVGLMLALTWGALQIQITLAGFLNGESLWSKAQKQSVIDLEAYAISGDAADLVIASDAVAAANPSGNDSELNEIASLLSQHPAMP